jgi:hypothetical protein
MRRIAATAAALAVAATTVVLTVSPAEARDTTWERVAPSKVVKHAQYRDTTWE